MRAVLPRRRISAAMRMKYPVAVLLALALLVQSAVAAPPAADMTIAIGHSGNFTQGDVGDAYTLNVANAGSHASTGTVTATDTLPSGLTATNIDGSGWSCTLATLTCTRSDALAAGTSYPAITLTVNVAGNAAAMVTNHASVSGGGETNTGNDSASDPTTVTQKVPDLSIDVFHSGTWSEGDVGDTYSLRVDNSNIGGFSTDGSTVTVVDTLSPGLTATAIGGPGWTCDLPTLTCSRSDVLANFTTYPFITVTVNVAANASTPQSSSATVSGGGDTNTVNNSWSDVTAIVQKPDLTIAKSHGGIWSLGAVEARPHADCLQRRRHSSRCFLRHGGHADGPRSDGDRGDWLGLHAGDADVYTQRRPRQCSELSADHRDRGCSERCVEAERDERGDAPAGETNTANAA